MTDIAEELRIIARDRGRHDLHDLTVITRAAEIVGQLTATQEALIESQARQIATNDRLLALLADRHRKLVAPLSASFTITGYRCW